MLNTEKEKLEQLTRELTQAYFVQRDYPKLMRYIAPQVSWFGTGANEVCRNLTEAMRYLTQEQDLYRGSFLVTNEWYHATLYTDRLAVVMAQMDVETAPYEKYFVHIEKMRFSVIYTRSHSSWRVCHIHNSIPYHAQGDASFFDRDKAEREQARIQKLALVAAEEYVQDLEQPNDADAKPLEAAVKDRVRELLADPLDAARIIELFDGYVEAVKSRRRSQLRAGMERAREHNVRLGRPPVEPPDGFPEIYQAIKAGTLTKAAAAKEMGVSAGTVARLCERYEASQLQEREKRI